MTDATQGRPVVVVHETLSGVVIHITPLSPFTLTAIRERAEELYPYPDPAPYETPLENAADPSIRLSADENPAYKEAKLPVDMERMEWQVQTVIDLACRYPAFPTQEQMLAHFRPALERLKKVAKLPDDEWQAVLMHCVFTGRGERQTVIDIASQHKSVPLTPDEVGEGIRFFRAEVPQ